MKPTIKTIEPHDSEQKVHQIINELDPEWVVCTTHNVQFKKENYPIYSCQNMSTSFDCENCQPGKLIKSIKKQIQEGKTYECPKNINSKAIAFSILQE